MARNRDVKKPAEEEAPAAEPQKQRFELEFYVDDDGKAPVLEWLRGLSLTKKQVLGQAMNNILQELGIAVCATEFGKQLGRGLFEFRLRQKVGDVGADKAGKKLPPEDILLRVFLPRPWEQADSAPWWVRQGRGHSKKRQDKEIAEARSRLASWKARK